MSRPQGISTTFALIYYKRKKIKNKLLPAEIVAMVTDNPQGRYTKKGRVLRSEDALIWYSFGAKVADDNSVNGRS